MKTIGFLDYYLDEWHAEHYPAWIEQASNGGMKVAYAYGMTDKENGLTNAAWCANKGIALLDTIEEVVAKSDYLIVLSPDHPEFHEALAALPLRSGKPTYVDKTFAPDRRTALALFELAREHGTALFSTSALRFAPEYAGAAREGDGIVDISSAGPGLYGNYAIHQVEPIVALMGYDATRVMFIGTEAAPALLIGFADGRQAELRHFGWDCPFSLTVKYASGATGILKPEADFFQAFVKRLIAFFETGEAPVDPAETVAIATILEYGRLAAEKPYEWIELPSGDAV